MLGTLVRLMRGVGEGGSDLGGSDLGGVFSVVHLSWA